MSNGNIRLLHYSAYHVQLTCCCGALRVLKCVKRVVHLVVNKWGLFDCEARASVGRNRLLE